MAEVMVAAMALAMPTWFPSRAAVAMALTHDLQRVRSVPHEHAA
jgi:hypothetical protein